MPANAKIKTACPVCGAKYKVATVAVGHSARCSRCNTKFRVSEYAGISKHAPSEEDILKWLNEEMDEAEFLAPPSPARINVTPAHTEPDPVVRTAAEVETEATPAASPTNRLTSPVTEPADPLQFRKTG